LRQRHFFTFVLVTHYNNNLILSDPNNLFYRIIGIG
jgi:hypothetical protein